MKKSKETKGQCPLKMQSMTPVYVSGKKYITVVLTAF